MILKLVGAVVTCHCDTILMGGGGHASLAPPLLIRVGSRKLHVRTTHRETTFCTILLKSLPNKDVNKLSIYNFFTLYFFLGQV